MKYYIDNEEVSELEFKEELETAITEYVEANYDDMLDDLYPEYEIGVITLLPSFILKNCDPIAYDCGKDDFIDAELTDRLDEFERCNCESEIWGKTFKTVMEGEE